MDKKIGKGDIMNDLASYAVSCALKVAKMTNFQYDEKGEKVNGDDGKPVILPLANPRSRSLKLSDFVEYLMTEDEISDNPAENIRSYLAFPKQHKFEKAREERERKAAEYDAASAKYLDGLL